AAVGDGGLGGGHLNAAQRLRAAGESECVFEEIGEPVGVGIDVGTGEGGVVPLGGREVLVPPAFEFSRYEWAVGRAGISVDLRADRPRGGGIQIRFGRVFVLNDHRMAAAVGGGEP